MARDSGHLCSEAAEMTKFRRNGPRPTAEKVVILLTSESFCDRL